MANDLVSLRIPKNILRETELAVAREGYTNAQEYIREALREKLEKRKIRETLVELKKLEGSAKNPKILSKKELNRLIMKEYGI
jgi:Arc/MetJ-type ribon-helix-helix transcriptional regulator